MNRLCICLVLSTVFFLTGCVESREIYQFKRDGTCIRTIIWTNKNEEESRTEIYYRWAFYNQGSNTIYFGESHYWDIEELTSTKFAVYNRFGEYGSLDMSREYMELSPLK